MVVTALHMRTSTNGRSRKWKQSWRMRRSVEDRCARKWRVFHRRIADKLHRRRPRPTSNWRSTSIIWQPCVQPNPGPDSFQLDLKSTIQREQGGHTVTRDGQLAILTPIKRCQWKWCKQAPCFIKSRIGYYTCMNKDEYIRNIILGGLAAKQRNNWHRKFSVSRYLLMNLFCRLTTSNQLFHSMYAKIFTDFAGPFY